MKTINKSQNPTTMQKQNSTKTLVHFVFHSKESSSPKSISVKLHPYDVTMLKIFSGTTLVHYACILANMGSSHSDYHRVDWAI